MPDIVTKETKITAGNAPSSTPTTKNPPVEEEKAEKSQTIGYIIYFIFGLIEVLLLFRLIFKLTGANPISGFVSAIYGLTEICIAPFVGIFPQATTTGVTTTAILEPATIVALIVYAVLAWGITQVVVILSRRLQ